MRRNGEETYQVEMRWRSTRTRASMEMEIVTGDDGARVATEQIKRCSEMARKLRFFKEQMVKGGLLPSLRSTSGTDINLDDVEVKLGELEAELMEMNANSEKLQCAYNELLEYKLVLQKLPRSHLRQVHNEFHENALQMAGISVVGRNYYGVFPLRGTLLNVREASHKQIMENAEITSIKQILGLQHGKQYDSVKTLRYGHLMIMTDQVFNMDGRRFIDAMFASQKAQSITQVVMNLPNDAAEYLDVFRGIFRTKPKQREITLPKIHVYGFSKATSNILMMDDG